MHAGTWPSIGSTQAQALAADWRIFTYCAIAVTLLVWSLILVAAVRFRRSPSNPSARSQRETNHVLELAWTIAPLLWVVALFVATQHIEARVTALAPAPALRVAVTGYRWSWSFAYEHGPTIAGTPQAPPELVLPLGETVALRLTSSDVAHSFWIPDMLFKRDALPGFSSTFDLTPTKVGTFIGRCGEFCGLEHTHMTFLVRVVQPSEYERWLQYRATQ